MSAVFFLDNVDAQALTIEPAEFDRAIAKSKRYAKEINLRIIHRNDPLPSSIFHGETNRTNFGNGVNNADEDVDKILLKYRREKATSSQTACTPINIYKGF